MNEAGRIYFDNAATTPPAPEVAEAMRPFLAGDVANPSALYRGGQENAERIGLARRGVARLIGADEQEIIFTSGATESNNWVLYNAALSGRRRRIIVSAIEHHAILEPARALTQPPFNIELTILPTDRRGIVDPAQLRAAIDDNTALVSVMHANNETGALQPVQELARIAHEAGALFHTDAVQSAGKIPLAVRDIDADFASLSAHKLHGPKGIGALYCRAGVRLRPLLAGGSQEYGLRAGTSNTAAIVGFGAAAELASSALAGGDCPHREIVASLWRSLCGEITGLHLNTPLDSALPGYLNFSVEGADGETLMMYLDMEGFCVATGSACSARDLNPSHVLLAMGRTPELARGALRITLSRYNTAIEAARLAEVLPPLVIKSRELGARLRAVPLRAENAG